MNQKKIGILFIVLGIITLIISLVVFLTKNNDSQNNNKDNSENKENVDKDNDDNRDDEKDNDKQNDNVCLNDYLNANFKEQSSTIKDKDVKIKVLSCMSEKEVADNKVKFFSKQDDSYYFEISIVEGSMKEYSENLNSEYKAIQQIENYNIATTDEYTTENSKKYSIVNVYRKDENDNVNYKDYNMINQYDERNVLHLRLVTTKYDLESDFIRMVEESLEIK